MNNENMKSDQRIQSSRVANSSDESEGFAIGELVAVVMEHRWLIATVTSVFLALGVAWTVVSQPMYRADGMIQVEEKSSGFSALKDLQPLLGDSTTVSAELEILTSRMVLGRVIEKLKLDIEATPKTFPLIGGAIARRYKKDELARPLMGLESYAWGGEKVQVDTLQVPRALLDKPLILTAAEDGNFEISDEDSGMVTRGKVGERTEAKAITIFVSRLVARPGTRFVIVKHSSETSIKALRDHFGVKERGKKSGILETSLTGADAEKTVMVLDDILNTYVRQNVEQRSAEAENTLRFLETQLPVLKKEMDAAEAAYNNYRQSRGSLDLNIETQSVLQSLVEVDNQIVALRQERDELRQSFTAEHPRVRAVDQRLERLRERRKQFDGDVNKLPDTQQKVLQLARDVEVSTTLYTNLVNTAQQLRVSKAGTTGDVRIIDSAAASADPVGMKRSAVIAISAFLGMLAALALVWAKRSLRVVVEDPNIIEEKIGIPVYATIPHSDEEVLLAKRNLSKKSGELLAIKQPTDDAMESLRGLRTTIHFALMDSTNNSILITGPSPGLGKSFISKNLGAVLAQSGKRVVIVDADLRRGHINKEFCLTREVGVSEYVSASVGLDEIVKPTVVPNLWVVTTGQIPPNPSELLMHLRFEELIERLGKKFDVVLIDSPPILAVADAAIIGRVAGATLIVARAGRHPIAELEQAVKRMTLAGVSVKGFVFNGFNLENQKFRYGYKGYVYKYTYS